MWFVAAVVFVVVMMVISRARWNPRGTDVDVPVMARLLAGYFTVGILIAFLLTFLQDSVVVVPPGSRGVVFDRFKGIKPEPLKEGMNFIVPFVQSATILDVRVQKVEFGSSAASKDLQSVSTKVALNYRPIADQVTALYGQVGFDYAEKIIHPAVQEAVKAATARYTAEELITRREEVKNQIQQLLSKHVSAAHLVIDETFITDFDFSPEFSRAIESKQIAEQQALKARRDLDRVKIEAEQKVAQARAEAESLRMQRDAISAQMLELRKIEMQTKAIEKWDGKMPNVMMGGATPFIDMTEMTKERR